ncbi:MAG: NADH:ubiquinone reductase (Na(+)-transporting) subunit C [Prevotella sp.]|nr:NADH:ubiquinone reductase (Na(+)-transporting) subunit C [Prevotella sp.]
MAKLNTNSNVYTVLYSVIIVIVVAFLLAFVSSFLKPKQDINVALDKKKQILAALNIRDLSDAQVEQKYSEVIMCDNIIDDQNNLVAQGSQGGENVGFKLGSADYKAGQLAVYVCNVDGNTKYVVPVYGMGLWGPISGYIGIDDDKCTIYGAYFTHESETAGLGAEIKDNKQWQAQFQGKKIFKDGTEGIALEVVKKNEVKDATVQCDAVTGATLTSNGVSLMLQDCLSKYVEFLNDKQ